MLKKFFLDLFLLLNVTAFMKASRVKIFTVDTGNHDRRFLRQAPTTACDDKVAVSRDSLNLPGRLNMLNGRVRFYQSNIVT